MIFLSAGLSRKGLRERQVGGSKACYSFLPSVWHVWRMEGDLEPRAHCNFTLSHSRRSSEVGQRACSEICEQLTHQQQLPRVATSSSRCCYPAGTVAIDLLMYPRHFLSHLGDRVLQTGSPGISLGQPSHLTGDR